MAGDAVAGASQGKDGSKREPGGRRRSAARWCGIARMPGRPLQRRCRHTGAEGHPGVNCRGRERYGRRAPTSGQLLLPLHPGTPVTVTVALPEIVPVTVIVPLTCSDTPRLELLTTKLKLPPSS